MLYTIPHHTQLLSCITRLLEQSYKPQKTRVILPNHQLCANLVQALAHLGAKLDMPNISAFYAIDFHAYSEKNKKAASNHPPTSFIEERLLLTEIICQQQSIQEYLSFTQAFALSKDLLLFWYDSQKNNNFAQLLQEQRAIERAEHKTIIYEFLEEVFALFNQRLTSRISIAEQYKINLLSQKQWLAEDANRRLIIAGILPTNKLLIDFFTDLAHKHQPQAHIILPPLLDASALNIPCAELEAATGDDLKPPHSASDYSSNSNQNIVCAMHALLKTIHNIAPIKSLEATQALPSEMEFREKPYEITQATWVNNFFYNAENTHVTFKYLTCQTVAYQGNKIAQIIEELTQEGCNRIALLIKNSAAKTSYLAKLILAKKHNIIDLSLNTLSHDHQYNILIHLSHLASSPHFNLSRFIKLVCNPSINKKYAQSFLLFANRNNLAVAKDIATTSKLAHDEQMRGANESTEPRAYMKLSEDLRIGASPQLPSGVEFGLRLIELISSSPDIPSQYCDQIITDLRNLSTLLAKPRERFDQILQIMLEMASVVFNIKWGEDFIEIIEQMLALCQSSGLTNDKYFSAGYKDDSAFANFVLELLKEQRPYNSLTQLTRIAAQQGQGVFAVNLEQLLFNSYDAIIIPDFNDAVWNFNDDQGFWLNHSLAQSSKLLQSYFLSVVMNHSKLFLIRSLRDDNNQTTRHCPYLLLMPAVMESAV
ncbi:hypothetical protein Sarmat_00179 [Rickettsiales endosymbiont of Paramecium tredecaurelia]|uniref:hypothetical protein n=1 Tax=Candidatus Sarmatiella mevalonica TaxID=2770581 RepID=UPI001923B597|nr:hypothetical protein [Candidatus Sarmatiella mevalonica]MBL3284339.1 hypothetical protein [Candidatus Sarmatiella mevalonica]